MSYLLLAALPPLGYMMNRIGRQWRERATTRRTEAATGTTETRATQATVTAPRYGGDAVTRVLAEDTL